MEKLVISIGGSLIVPDDVDYEFLKKLKSTVKKIKDTRIVIVTGGGKTARKYMEPLSKAKISRETVERIGIDTTRLNAKLVADFIGECNQKIPHTITEAIRLTKKHRVVITGGFKPGTTSDGTTARIAEKLKVKTIINMTNVDGLYTKDPSKYKTAKKIEHITHKDFKKIIDSIGYKPGQHFVLDPLAAEIARNANIDVVIMKGLDNLEKLHAGRDYEGTLIH